MNDHAAEASKRSHPPLWLVEGIDIMQRRRLLLLTVAGAVIVLAIILAATVPAIVPPVAGVGVAVGIAALLLGLAAAVAMDATDLRLRGPRHVGAAGGELVAVLPVEPTLDDAAPLAAAVLDARSDDGPMLLGLAASGREVEHTAAWTDMLGRALVERDVSVLTIDLATGSSDAPGLVEVIRDGVKLTEAVTFEPGKRLARLGAGGDHTGALESLATLPGRLPRDLDVLLVALPTAASRQVVTVVQALDHVLVVAERDKTSRVDLIAGLDALESAGTRAQVALLDDRTAARLAPPRPRTPTSASQPEADAGRGSSAPDTAQDGGVPESATDQVDVPAADDTEPVDVPAADDTEPVDVRAADATDPVDAQHGEPTDELDAQVGDLASEVDVQVTEPTDEIDGRGGEPTDEIDGRGGEPVEGIDESHRDVDAADDSFSVLALPTDPAALAAAGQLTLDTSAERGDGGSSPSTQDTPDASAGTSPPPAEVRAATTPLTQEGPVFVKPTGARPSSPSEDTGTPRQTSAVDTDAVETHAVETDANPDPDPPPGTDTHRDTARMSATPPAVGELDQEHDDLLTTTAQLAGLKQDLARRLGDAGGTGSGTSRSLPR